MAGWSHEAPQSHAMQQSPHGRFIEGAVQRQTLKESRRKGGGGEKGLLFIWDRAHAHRESAGYSVSAVVTVTQSWLLLMPCPVPFPRAGQCKCLHVNNNQYAK